jgi:RecA-family ATPase
MLDDEFIKETEEIVVGTGRGDVAQLVSVTDVGKTTLILNTCLRMAAGLTSLPLAPDVPTPRRVLYVDCEATSRLCSKSLLVVEAA